MSISCLWLDTRLNNSSHRQHFKCIQSRDVRNFRVPHLSGLHFVAVCLTNEYTNDKWIQMDSVACRIKTVQLQSARSLSAFKICFRSFDEAFATVQSCAINGSRKVIQNTNSAWIYAGRPLPAWLIGHGIQCKWLLEIVPCWTCRTLKTIKKNDWKDSAL